MASSTRRNRDTVSRYVDALGDEAASRVFLQLGGSQVYLPGHRSLPTGPVVSLVGIDATRALVKEFDLDGVGGYVKVPLARRWLVQHLDRIGKTGNQIARLVRADVETVRRMLNGKTYDQQQPAPRSRKVRYAGADDD